MKKKNRKNLKLRTNNFIVVGRMDFRKIEALQQNADKLQKELCGCKNTCQICECKKNTK